MNNYYKDLAIYNKKTDVLVRIINTVYVLLTLINLEYIRGIKTPY